MWKLYAYEKCSTCRKAIAALRAASVPIELIPIRESPPSMDELTRALAGVGGTVRKLFNTSGLEYRARNMGELLKTLSTHEALAQLHSNGSLVKRPFLVTPNQILVGYDPKQWEDLIQSGR